MECNSAEEGTSAVKAENASLTRARLAAIVDSSFDAIVSKTLDGTITSWNKAAERLFGYSAEEIISKNIRLLIPQNRQDEEDAIIARVSSGERTETFDTVRVHKSGKLVSISLTVSPIKDDDGHIVGASKIARDITSAKESERQIRTLLREVNHRVKNQLSVIQAIVRETARRAVTVKEFEEQFLERLRSLSKSHDLLVASDWQGAYLGTLIEDQMRPFGNDSLVHMSGTLLHLAPVAVVNIGMAMHELATNSAKYGVLAGGKGNITVEWNIAKAEVTPELHLTWSETDFSLEENEQTRKPGFGSVVLLRISPQALDGVATFSRTDGRRIWHLRAPLDRCLSEGTGEKSF
ncbi:PAS domain S-box protein [Phyllobacterium sp. 0TCS1.6C]|uniref:sensor histidine kinase n=1 Tax=unclassified Phyllobacterium TaxID=2638441 RepID=UPI002263D69B|nr:MULTISPECIES: PAS domain S-box protein [unclassified Phyllobacterium]MCX8282497.1 PAS domain S-box protein [Phyllobacterium sp. 0TCS1.6C]MCX8292589.1 PAS domain S-box protein [Phyllobacterium sp. 0TCS1.6A]